MKAFSLILYLFILTVYPSRLLQAASGTGRVAAGVSGEDSLNPPAGRFVFSFGTGGGMSYMTYGGLEGDPYGPSFTSGIRPCLSTNFRIGYAPADRILICWNSRANWFYPVIKDPYSERSLLLGGGAGLSASFFPSAAGKRVYLNVLFGYSNLGFGFKPDYNRLGTTLGIGAGYLLMKHCGIELNLQTGTSEKWFYSGYLKNPVLMNLTINYLFWKD